MVRDPEGFLRQGAGLAVGQSEGLVQPGRECHRPRTRLGGRRSQGVRSLLGVAALHARAAPIAKAHVYVEGPHEGLDRRDLGLVLLLDPVLDNGAAAVWATPRERGVEGLLSHGAERRA